MSDGRVVVLDEREVGQLRAWGARAARRRRARRRARRGRRATRRAGRRPRARARPAPPARRSAGRGSRRARWRRRAPSSSGRRRAPEIHDASSRHALSPSADVPVSLGSSPMTTSTAAPARNPVTTAFDRNCAIQPSRSTASSRNSTPVASAIAATSCAASGPAEAGRQHRAARHGRQRRARPGRDVPGRAEERVDDRAGGRRVEAVLQRDARDAGVAEVLRHDRAP